MTITDLLDVPRSINQDGAVRSAKLHTMRSLLGEPRRALDYTDRCQPITNPGLLRLVVLENVGPFRVTGLQPAVESLRAVFADVAAEAPEVYAGLGTAGMLCVRRVRGSRTAVSNHSWGTAIDLTLNGVLDPRGDDRVQAGLATIAPIFNRHGWFWGAGFRTEDAMHFEVGDDLIRQWHTEGRFGPAAGPAPAPMLSLGDRGPEVRELQQRLNAAGASLRIDGDFGPATEAAVKAFQQANGLTVDGIVGPATREKLGTA